MSSVSSKDIALSIINFLKQSVNNKEITEDYTESMDVAIDCIADAFEVNKDDDSEIIKNKFNGKSLAELVNLSLSSATVSANADESAEINSEAKERADQLKVEGNRAMAAKNFSEAIEKYTQAIELDSKNVVYLSNRAAAYSSSSQHEKAAQDAQAAIELNPNFSKAYSRLGLAQYALGDANASMEAYKKGLEVEGDNKSEAMNKGYETAKRRVEEELEKAIPQKDVAETSSEDASRGMPDFSSMFGGAGGMPSLSEMMNNPQIMQAAQEMMSNPSAMAGLMNNPAVRQMAQNFGLGGAGGQGGESGQGSEGGSGPDLSDLMNNPMLQNMANQFMGGNRGNGNGSN